MPTKDEIHRREHLLDKLKNHTIEKDEAIELRNLLQKEQSEATTLGNLAIVIGTSILLGLLADHLSKNKFDLGRILGFRKSRR